MRYNNLIYYGHLLGMDDDARPKMVKFHNSDGRQTKGRPRKRLYNVINELMLDGRVVRGLIRIKLSSNNYVLQHQIKSISDSCSNPTESH